jgi:hypothetical protein
MDTSVYQICVELAIVTTGVTRTRDARQIGARMKVYLAGAVGVHYRHRHPLQMHDECEVNPSGMTVADEQDLCAAQNMIGKFQDLYKHTPFCTLFLI